MNTVELWVRRRLCQALAVLGFAAVGAAMPAQADTLRLGGTGSALGSMALLAKAYQQKDPSFQLEVVPNLGSTGGIKALQSGATQLAAVSRPLKPEEVAAGLQVLAYGRTPFVVATRKSGIDGLSLAQLAELYGGRQTRWADGQPVRLVLRPANDGDTALLASFSPAVKAGLDTAMARDGMVVALTDQDSADAIERLPGALGTSSLALLSAEHRRARALAIDGVMPTVANVVNGRYPFVKTMLLVAKAPVPPAVSQFLAFVASDAGRRLLAEHGHAPALPDKAPAASAPAAAAAALAAR